VGSIIFSGSSVYLMGELLPKAQSCSRKTFYECVKIDTKKIIFKKSRGGQKDGEGKV